VRPAGAPEAKVQLVLPRVGDIIFEGTKWEAMSDDECAFWAGNASLRRVPRELFQVCAIPVFRGRRDADNEADATAEALKRPPKEVRWYIYACLDHGYCDCPAGMPLFTDLLRLYADEAVETGSQQQLASTAPPQALEVLVRRLWRSLLPMPEAMDTNDDIFHDGLLYSGYHKGYQRLLRFDAPLMQLLRFAAEEALGVSIDIAWLTVISIAFLRLFPALRRLDLYLVVTCRDRPSEEAMVGYFSSRKLMPLEVGDPRHLAILGLSDMIASARKMRTWRRPRPFEKFSSIEVNIVSLAADGLPFGFREVRCARNAPTTWERGGNGHMNLRLDQVARNDWDFRMHSHNGAWGGHWSSYFTQAMGAAIVDMALHPTDPILPEIKDR